MLALAGCAGVQRGTTQIKWEKGQADDRVMKANDNGRYALYRGSDVKPQFIVPLKAGDKLGFRHGDAGKVIAVYGNETMTFDEDKYYWNYRGD